MTPGAFTSPADPLCMGLETAIARQDLSDPLGAAVIDAATEMEPARDARGPRLIRLCAQKWSRCTRVSPPALHRDLGRRRCTQRLSPNRCVRRPSSPLD